MKSSTWWNISLWIAQLFLAFVFIQAGATKVLEPHSLPYPWIQEHRELATVTGIIDLLAGLGLVLPALLRIKPILVVYAAYGTILLMISAALFHIARVEASVIGFNVLILFVAAFIAWGRVAKAPIKGR